MKPEYKVDSFGQFKPIFINGKTLGDTYFQLLSAVYEHGRRYKITEGSFAGASRLEFDFAAGFIEYPHDKPLAPIMPEGGNIPPTTTDEKIDDYFANYLMDPNLEPDEEYRYSSWINGPMLPFPDYCLYTKCENYKPDETIINNRCKIGDVEISSCELAFTCPENKPNTQLEWVIHHFNTKGHGNNHCAITVGDKHSSLGYEVKYNSELERRTSPCLRLIDFAVKDGKLVTFVTFRSWDLYAGFPENCGGFTLLNEYVAASIGVEPGPLQFSSIKLHCYDFQIEPLKALLKKD